MDGAILASITSLIFIGIALSFGSFANVLIYRVPRELSIIKPHSFCPSCKTPLKLIDKIPLLSYIFLKGKCRFCSAPISISYPIVEALVAIASSPLIYVLVWKQGFQTNKFLLLIFLISFVTLAISLAFIDQKFHKLPHELTYSGILLGLLYSLLFGSWQSALIAIGTILFLFDFLTHFANKLFFKERAMAIAPAALSFRTNFLSKKITWIYIALIVLIVYFIKTAQWQNLSLIFLVIGILYIINDIFIDFFFLSPKMRHEFYTKNLKASIKKEPLSQTQSLNNEPLTALGGGDAAMAAFVGSFLYLKTTLIALLAAFYIALVLTLLEYLYCKIRGKNMSLSQKFVPLGSSLAIAAIIAIIVEYVLI